MPYNPGTGIYTLPAVYLAVPGTTILATQHNTPLEDLEVANNYARPIIAGGTGSISAVTARGATTGIATEGNIGSKGSNIASAAALPLVDNFNYFHVTGTTGITSISTRTSGQRILLEFEGILLITHSAGLFLSPPSNRTTAAGDVAEFVSEGAGNWRMASYTKASGADADPSFFQIKATPGAFVYTPTPGARFADFEMVGGGGAGGNVDGQAGATGGAAGGGASGFYGRTGPIDITGAATFNGVIGAAGAVSGSTFGDGGNGGNTSITVGATTYTAGGGVGGGGIIASAQGTTQDGGAPGVGTNVVGFSEPGGMGVTSTPPATNGTGGNGASSPFGSGGKGPHVIAAATGANGGAAAGFGAGGAGAVMIQSTANTTGSAGTAGYMRIWEYY